VSKAIAIAVLILKKNNKINTSSIGAKAVNNSILVLSSLPAWNYVS
jgi:hypothetical protein